MHRVLTSSAQHFERQQSTSETPVRFAWMAMSEFETQTVSEIASGSRHTNEQMDMPPICPDAFKP
jgi:hypothetical protein